MALAVNFLGKDLNSIGLVLAYPKSEIKIVKYNGNIVDPEGLVTLDNGSRAFSADNSLSMLKGVKWHGEPILVTDDGGTILDGRVTSGQIIDNQFKIKTQSSLARMFQANVAYEAVGTDPALAALGILKSLNMDQYIDENSFNYSSGYYQDNNVSVSITISRKSMTNLSSALSVIALMGVAVLYQDNNKIYFEAFQPYQGKPAYSINRDNILNTPKVVRSNEANIKNAYNLGYLLDGDVPAQKGNTIDTQKTWANDYGSGAYVMNNLTTATFLGDLRIQRDEIPKDVISLELARDSLPLKLNQVYSVTVERLGWVGRYALLTRLQWDNKTYTCEFEEIDKINHADWAYGYNHGSYNEGSYNDSDI